MKNEQLEEAVKASSNMASGDVRATDVTDHDVTEQQPGEQNVVPQVALVQPDASKSPDCSEPNRSAALSPAFEHATDRYRLVSPLLRR